MKTARFIDDLAQMAGGAVSIASSLREQIRQRGRRMCAIDLLETTYQPEQD